MKFRKGITKCLVGALLATFGDIAYSQIQTENSWQRPDQDILDVLYAPQLPWVWTSPTGKNMVMGDPIFYPTLEEMSAPMHKLAGIRVNPKNNGWHGDHGATSARVLNIESGVSKTLELPEGSELHSVRWTVDGEQFALTVDHKDHFGLWVGDISGNVKKIEGVKLNPLMGGEVQWLPNQKEILVLRIPLRDAPPQAPAIPNGPEIKEGKGATARSTYEARNLLQTAHDDALFDYYCTSEIAIVDPKKGDITALGMPAVYTSVDHSPNGKHILVERLVGPWSHEVARWRFAKEIEIWDTKGNVTANIASLPLADAVPVHGVRLGPRSVRWRPTEDNTLYWVEALDGGNPVAEAEHRDRIMRLKAPFTGEAEEVFKAQHRIMTWSMAWGSDGMLMVTQRERIKRWRYTWLLNVDKGSSKQWFDYDEGDRYGSPGSPLYKYLPNGFWVLREHEGSIYFRGAGGTDKGDRPFLDKRNLETGEKERLFRCDPDRYEYFVAFAGDENTFVMRSESAKDVPNYYLGTFGEKIVGAEGEATRSYTKKAITKFEDPTPKLRQITKQIIRYEREDSVPLSFQLLLPPGYKEGTPLPTVVYAYPLEYSGTTTAGQTRGSAQRFMRLYGASHLYFLLRGYAVLDQTAMPMVGDPETTYNTFVPQLVADAEAAVNKAVEMGVTDPNKIGIIGHSHGGLMVANLLAHSNLFKAGIARSGSYNKTNQPFGFQSERRSLFEAQDVYIQVSPTFFADKVNEPVLIIHGADDSNPGTLTFQSEVFYEAVRGSGGTARLVLLPNEDHGYRAKESIEHVLWEQLEWFDTYVKNASVGETALPEK